MDVSVLRDWVIVMVFFLGIVMMFIMMLMTLVLYNRVKGVVNQIKQLINLMQKPAHPPYHNIANWIGGVCAGIGQSAQRGSPNK